MQTMYETLQNCKYGWSHSDYRYGDSRVQLAVPSDLQPKYCCPTMGFFPSMMDNLRWEKLYFVANDAMSLSGKRV